MAKLRSDSTFAKLPADVKEQVDDMLLSYKSLEAVQTYLDTEGVAVSQTAIGNYYNNHLLKFVYERNNSTAELIDQIDQGNLDDATFKAAKQRLFALMTTPGANPKIIKLYSDIILKATALQQDARKIALLEAKAAAADAAKEALERKVASGGLTPEALALAEEQLRLL